jgi:hypothetical protein
LCRFREAIAERFRRPHFSEKDSSSDESGQGQRYECPQENGGHIFRILLAQVDAVCQFDEKQQVHQDDNYFLSEIETALPTVIMFHDFPPNRLSAAWVFIRYGDKAQP